MYPDILSSSSFVMGCSSFLVSKYALSDHLWADFVSPLLISSIRNCHLKRKKKCLWKPIQLEKVAVAVWYLSSGTDFKPSLKLFGKTKYSVYNLCLLCFPKKLTKPSFYVAGDASAFTLFSVCGHPDHPQMWNLYASSMCSCCAFTSLFRAVHLWADHPRRFSYKTCTQLIFQILTEVTIPIRSRTLNQGDLAFFSYIC